MYLWLKLLHVIAVVLFLGNIITGLFWHAHAARTRDPGRIAHIMDGIIASDRLFTIPSVVVIAVTGVAAALTAGYPIVRTGWIFWSLVLFGVSGVIFMARVAPLQVRLRAAAAAARSGAEFDWPAYRRLALRWELWGGAALLTPLGALVLMVLKPQIPGL